MAEKETEMSKLSLEKIYKTHHEKGKRYGYLYCHGERGEYLSQWIGKNRTVLDIGCRDGELTKYFAEGNKVTGADIDRKALEIAKNKYGIDTVWLDINTEFPFEPGSFDVVVSCEIMEHIYYTEHFLEKVYSALNTGGMFFGSVPNSFRMRNRLKFLAGKEFETDPTHVHMFSFEKLKRMLERHFREVHIVPIGGKILPFLKVSKHMPCSLNRLFARDLLWKAVK